MHAHGCSIVHDAHNVVARQSHGLVSFGEDLHSCCGFVGVSHLAFVPLEHSLSDEHSLANHFCVSNAAIKFILQEACAFCLALAGDDLLMTCVHHLKSFEGSEAVTLLQQVLVWGLAE